jgi:hypothetical protein
MSKTAVYESAILGLLFNATSIANIAQNGISPLTSLWVSLHTSDPGEAGTQGTNEANYAGYARVSVARTTAGWAVTGGSVSPVTAITYPSATSTSTGTLTHFGCGASSASTGGALYYKGTISPNVSYQQNTVVRLTTGSSITES